MTGKKKDYNSAKEMSVWWGREGSGRESERCCTRGAWESTKRQWEGDEERKNAASGRRRKNTTTRGSSSGTKNKTK